MTKTFAIAALTAASLVGCNDIANAAGKVEGAIRSGSASLAASYYAGRCEAAIKVMCSCDRPGALHPNCVPETIATHCATNAALDKKNRDDLLGILEKVAEKINREGCDFMTK